MTAPEILRARMVELWGKVNVSRLARESSTDRSTVSRVVHGKQGLGEELAVRFGRVLEIPVDQLWSPDVEPANLATLLRRLEEARAAGDVERKALARALRRIHADLRRIEARLPAEAERAQEARR